VFVAWLCLWLDVFIITMIHKHMSDRLKAKLLLELPGLRHFKTFSMELNIPSNFCRKRLLTGSIRRTAGWNIYAISVESLWFSSVSFSARSLSCLDMRTKSCLIHIRIQLYIARSSNTLYCISQFNEIFDRNI
jgi:hypothetical protein